MTHFDSCDNLAFLYSAQFDAVESIGKKTGVNSPGDTFYNSHSTYNVCDLSLVSLSVFSQRRNTQER